MPGFGIGLRFGLDPVLGFGSVRLRVRAWITGPGSGSVSGLELGPGRVVSILNLN